MRPRLDDWLVKPKLEFERKDETHDSFAILGRTAKTVTIARHGKQVRRGIFVYNGVEQFKPFGTYSMCAIISADKVC
jgi:hypothetical protein